MFFLRFSWDADGMRWSVRHTSGHLGRFRRRTNKAELLLVLPWKGSNEEGAGMVVMALLFTLGGVCCSCRCGGRERGAGSKAGCARQGGAGRFPLWSQAGRSCLKRGFFSWHPPGHAQPRPPPHATCETQESLDNLQRADEIPISSKLHSSSAEAQGGLPLWDDLGAFIRGSIPPPGAPSQSAWLRPY